MELFTKQKLKGKLVKTTRPFQTIVTLWLRNDFNDNGNNSNNNKNDNNDDKNDNINSHSLNPCDNLDDLLGKTYLSEKRKSKQVAAINASYTQIKW